MEQPIQIAVCEDNPEDMRHLCALIEDFGIPKRIVHYDSGEAFLREFAAGRFQMVFLDIYLDGMTGVETARRLRAADRSCVLVFTTTSKEYAFESYGVGAIDYIVKPVEPEQVHRALFKAVKLLAPENELCLTVMSGKKKLSMPHNRILYVEVNNKISLIHTTRETISTYMMIGDIEKLLPSPPFLRCHRAYLVNLNYVADIGTDFLMKNGATVYIRQREYGKVRDTYMRHLVMGVRSGANV